MSDKAKVATALWIFVGIALGLPVLYWLLFYFARQAGWEPPRGVFGVLRSYGPTFAAIGALAYVGGRPALRDLWTSVIKWRVSGRLYAIALFGPLAVMTVAIGAMFFFAPEAMTLGDFNPLKLAAIFVVLIFLDGPLGEEPGWRGYFLPALMKKYNAIVASLLVGVVWFLWHLPHYHTDGKDLTPDYLVKYLLFTFALSFMHTWFFKRSGGSVLLNVLFHNMTNFVVLTGFTLFPALKDATLDNHTYLYIMLTVGALAAWSLWRTDNAPASDTGSYPGA